jgi:hypothetical protein
MNEEKELEKEISHLKAALALAVGSLESVRYLLSSPEVSQEKMDHIRSITQRVIKDIEGLAD